MFAISDKVVCIDDRIFHPNLVKYYSSMPIRGQVYVVRDYIRNRFHGEDCVILTGITSEIWSDGIERGFYPKRFRKLEEIKAENHNRKQNEIPDDFFER